LVSLDALRGFDMFWIISGEGIFHGLADGVKQGNGLIRNPDDWTISSNESLSLMERIVIEISNQLHHSPWNGFTFYDLIFPLFIFISGISMPFSYQKYLDEKTSSASKKVYFALIKRTLTLIILGVIVNGLFKLDGYDHTRFASVLGRIGLASFFAAVIYLNFTLSKQVVWFISILFVYYILMLLVPVPGFGAGVFTPETIPAICSAMLGIFTGTFIKNDSLKFSAEKKAGIILLAGILSIILGLIWSLVFPINKMMWTSSFVLFSGGWSMILFAFFYFIIDVKAFKKWSVPLVWIGTNSILIYVCAHGFFNFESTSQFIFGGLIRLIPRDYQQAGMWTGVLLIQLFFLRFFYQKKWFLKI
ncbi:MAG: DUF5009 domain-containing protein, partial [Pedobacter sp.]